MRPLLAAASVIALLAAWSQPAMAQRANPQQGSDPRRAGAGAGAGAAKLTQEKNPQDNKQGENDEKQIDDSYQPKGIEVGSFLLLPQMELDELYNTNIYARATDKRADFITRIAPEFQLRSRFSNHMLNVAARVEQFVFKTYKNDNHLDASANVDGRYDFSREWEGNGSLEAYQRYEDRGSPDDRGGKTPTRTSGFTGRTGSKIQAGRYTFSGEINGARRMFDRVETDTGSVIDNSDRNRWEMGAIGRGSYELFPGYAAVAELQANRRQYDNQFDRSGYNRSSTGWRAETGIGVDISQLIRGDFLVGYLRQDYEDPRFKDPAGFAVKSVFNWTPSRMTVVVLSLERSIQETTTVGASGLVHTGGSILARHELQRNIILTGTFSAFRDEFHGTDQVNWTYDSRARVIYALMPEFYVGGELGYRRRISNQTGSGFDQIVGVARLGVRM
ncbi:outer membrane beta-barrel protein [Azospirillum sp.]|uniref:outer membrane beta-barrel protein n=1 Tax=Azospirillum sp. TaxID=34012 RepID=UPI003D74B409